MSWLAVIRRDHPHPLAKFSQWAFDATSAETFLIIISTRGTLDLLGYSWRAVCSFWALVSHNVISWITYTWSFITDVACLAFAIKLCVLQDRSYLTGLKDVVFEEISQFAIVTSWAHKAVRHVLSPICHSNEPIIARYRWSRALRTVMIHGAWSSFRSEHSIASSICSFPMKS